MNIRARRAEGCREPRQAQPNQIARDARRYSARGQQATDQRGGAADERAGQTKAQRDASRPKRYGKALREVSADHQRP